MNTVSRLLFTSKRYEGDLRWNHCRVMVHSESIALFAGEGFLSPPLFSIGSHCKSCDFVCANLIESYIHSRYSVHRREGG